MIEIIDATRLRDSLQCLRLYYYRHERHWVPTKPRLPLVYGSGVHETLARHYLGMSVQESLRAFIEVWDREVTPFQQFLEEEDPKRNFTRWSETFVEYRKTYRTEPFKVLAVESPFLVAVTNDLALGGVIDLSVEYNGKPVIIDHKTTSVMSPQYFSSFNPHHQFSAYLYTASKLWGFHVGLLIVNNILVHPKKDEFQRVPVTRSEWQLEQFERFVINWWNIVRQCRLAEEWPMNDDRCQRWPGGCDYHMLCTDVQTDYRVIQPSSSLYRVEEWDPVKELRKYQKGETI